MFAPPTLAVLEKRGEALKRRSTHVVPRYMKPKNSATHHRRKRRPAQAHDEERSGRKKAPFMDEKQLERSLNFGAERLYAMIHDGYGLYDATLKACEEVNLDELHAADRLKNRGWETGDADARTVAQLFCDQVEFANVIVVNKMDLVDDEQRDRLRALLATMSPGAKLVEATRGAVDPRAVLGTGLFDGAAAAAHPDWLKEARVGEHVSESLEYGISSFAFKSRRPLDPTRLLRVLHAHTRDGLECVVRPDLFPERDGPAPAGRVVRAKGLVWLAVAQNHAQEGLASLAGRYFTIELGKPWAAATADAAPLSDEATDAAALWERLWGDRRTELVVIGQGLDHDAMDAALRASEVTDDELGAFQRRLRALRLDALVADLKRASDPRAIADVLKTLAAADVTVAMLHEFQWGRVVSKLRKHGSALVSVSATTLITKWRALAAAAGVPPAPPRAREDDAAADYAAAAAAARGDT